MGAARVVGASLLGVEAELVTVEGRFEPGDRDGTEVEITGLPDPVIRESRRRLLAALAESHLRPAAGRLQLNLVPAARKKSGEALDLALALAGAAACGHLDARWLEGALFLGELGLDGRLHAVPGGLAAALAAREAGLARLFAPPRTAEEAAAAQATESYAACDLASLARHISGAGPSLTPLRPPDPGAEVSAEVVTVGALGRVRGQREAKRALAIAAAGGHGLLLVGPPGAGKSLLARALPDLLPPPSRAERLEITRTLSAAGMWPGGLARRRPFRAPHHTASHVGLVGGGPQLAPGEISLAHGGVLFLDELAEFPREVLESLRQPLEEGRVTIVRAGRRVVLPARFQLVCAMNPCPCGYRGHPRVPCRCSRPQIDRYRQRISGPLLDRIELRLELLPPTVDQLVGPPPDGDDDVGLVRAVRRASERRRARQGERPNAVLDAEELALHAPLDAPSRRLLRAAAERAPLSARAVDGLRRVARTIADLAGDDAVGENHLAEALALRGAWL